MMAEPSVADYPTTPEEWHNRIQEILEKEITEEKIKKALAGAAVAKGEIQAIAVELQAAAIFLATYQGAMQATQDALIELVNTVIDTLQAILIALGIIYLLKKVKKKRTDIGIGIDVAPDRSERVVRSDLGDKVNPRPSQPDSQDEEKNAKFLFWRLQWATHYLDTVMQAAVIQDEFDGVEMEWRAHLDTKTCSICRYMHGKTSINGDFLPVILKMFKTYTPYTPIMPWPHAHPRCRCIAIPAD